jgi:hypothetical protein
MNRIKAKSKRASMNTHDDRQPFVRTVDETPRSDAHAAYEDEKEDRARRVLYELLTSER